MLSLQECRWDLQQEMMLELFCPDQFYLSELLQNGINEERKWILVPSLLLIHMCNYLLVFTEELNPNSPYWEKICEEITYTVFVKRTVCFNIVSECLVALHISFTIKCPVKETFVLEWNLWLFYKSGTWFLAKLWHIWFLMP